MNPSADSAEIEAAAASWFAKRESGVWNGPDQAQLETWLDASTAHRIAFVRLVTAWERSGRLSALGAGVPAGTIPPRDAWGFAPSSRAPAITNRPAARAWFTSRLSRRAIAALLVLAIAAGAVWRLSTDRPISYRTEVGAVSTIALADGSKVTLNTDSQIHVALDPTLRRIELDRGEAFFEVSKDAARPFVVEIADKRVIAVGTQFSVRRVGEDVRVLVTEGRVRIDRRNIAAAAAQTELAAGSEARSAQSALLIDQPTPERIAQLLSWRTGYIVFRDTALADAIADFNRYNTRKIVIQDPAIAAIRIGGNLRSSDIDAFLWLLQSGFPINVEQRSDRIILTKR